MAFKLTDLNADELAGLKQQVDEETERRRPKIQIEDIRPGMSKEATQAAWAEIRRALGVGK